MRKQPMNGNSMISGRSKTSSGKDTLSDKDRYKKYNAESTLWKAKKKRNNLYRRQNAMQYNVRDHDLPEDASMKNANLERNSCMGPTVDFRSKTGSEITHCDAGLSLWLGKKKRKIQKAKHNALESNDIHHECPEGTSVNNAPLDRDSFAQTPVMTCLKADTEMIQYDAVVSLSEDVNKEKEQNKGNNASGFSDISHDLQDGGKLGIGSMEEHDDHAGADNALIEARSIKTYERKKRVKTYRRKKRKVSDSPENSLESIKEGAGSSVLVVQNRSTSLDLPDEGVASVSLENMLERKMVAGHGTSLKVVEGILMEKASGGCSEFEHATGERENRIVIENSKRTMNGDSFTKDVSIVDLPEENFEQTKRVKLSVIQDANRDMYSAEENIDDSTRLCKEDKASGDACGRDPLSEHLNQKGQSKMEATILSSSRLGAMKDDVDEIINKDQHPPQILLSSLDRVPNGCFKKKLLVLDVNGLLADIVSYVPFGFKADTIIAQKAVFKRPFCDDFLQFCFERFNVGVWSSRTKKNVKLVIDFLMGETRHNLLFCWDQSHCTETGFNTVENRDKPLVLKELKKLWEKHEPDLPWEKGEYNESNTLLLDDSPYKALRNPPNTAIFPQTYQYQDEKDNSLGPGGDLRVYLEGLALAENVQKYVEQNPFGQRPITKTNLSWRYYLKVIGTASSQLEDDAVNSSACR